MRRFYILLLVIMVWLPVASNGSEFSAQVDNVQIVRQDLNYVLSADISYRLSNGAMQALQNGVPLFWILQIKLQQQRDYLWNVTLLTKDINYRIQYHALLNVYRVRNEGSGEVYNFSTLAAALKQMSALHGLPLIEVNRVEAEQHYFVAIKVFFNRDALPLPLRPIAYTSPQWYLSSEWTSWPLPK